MDETAGRRHPPLEIVREDHRPFASLLPHGPVVGNTEDGIILLQEPKNPRDAALGCVWKVEPRNVGAIADPAVEQMAAVLQGLFRSLLPGTTISGAHAHGSHRPGGRVVGVQKGRPGPLQPERVPGGQPKRRAGARRRRQALAAQGDDDAHDGEAVGAHPRHQAPAAGVLPVSRRADPAQAIEPPDRDGAFAGGRRA